MFGVKLIQVVKFKFYDALLKIAQIPYDDVTKVAVARIEYGEVCG